MKFAFHGSLWREVKKLCLIPTLEAPEDTQIQSPTTVTMSSRYNGIGEIVSLGGLEKLSSHKKYSILKNHFKLSKTYVFPKIHI